MRRKFMAIALAVLMVLPMLATACTGGGSNQLTKLSVVTQPDKKEYIAGETFDKTGLKVEAVYSKAENEDVTDELTIPSDVLTAGQEKITVSYTEGSVTKSVDIAISVRADLLQSLVVATQPTKYAYAIGADFDPTGLKVEATYEVAANKDVTSSLLIPEDALVEDQDKVTVSYTEGTITKEVDVPVKVVGAAPGDADEIYEDQIPDSNLEFSATVGTLTAESHWYVEYDDTDDEVVISTIVEDAAVRSITGDKQKSDGVEVYLSAAVADPITGYSDGTLHIIATANDDKVVSIYDEDGFVAAESDLLDKIDITITTLNFDGNFDNTGTYIQGYQVEIAVGYDAIIDFVKAEKNLSAAFKLNNSNGSSCVSVVYDEFGTNISSQNTYFLITDSNTFAENPNFVKIMKGFTMRVGDDFESTSGWRGIGEYNDEDSYVENVGANLTEQQIYLDEINHVSFYAEVEIWVGDTYNGNAKPKVGLSLDSTSRNLFYFIDVNSNRNNNWGSYGIRDNTGSATDAWIFDKAPVPHGTLAYRFLGDVSYNKNYKKLAVLKTGTAIHFFSDGKEVIYTEGMFGYVQDETEDEGGIETFSEGTEKEHENIAVSIRLFDLNVRARKPVIITDEAELAAKMATLGVGAKAVGVDGVEKAVDGDLSDWTDAQKTNPVLLAATGERLVKIYAHTATDGVYLGVDAKTNTFVDNNSEWHKSTNLEFRFNLNGARGVQRYYSCNGEYPRNGNDTGDVGYGAHSSSAEGNFKRTYMEVFIPWNMLEGYDATSEFVLIGLAFKTGGETGQIWETNQDFWYHAEGDPWNNQNQKITCDGFYIGADYGITIDGDIDDWAEEITDNAGVKEEGDRTFTYCAYLGDNGVHLYMNVVVDTEGENTININSGAAWSSNPSFEGRINSTWIRATVVSGVLIRGGNLSAAAYVISEDGNGITFEIFVPYHVIPGASKTSTLTLTLKSYATGGTTVDLITSAINITSAGLPVVAGD